MNGVVKYVCTSRKRGTVKRPVDGAHVITDHGIQGDAHAGHWHRQVSLLDEADIATMRARGFDIEPGAYGENLVVDGLDLESLGIGTILMVNDVRLEITQIGKVCHTRCAIYYRSGDCIMPRAGLFARALSDGTVRPGDSVTVSQRVPRETLQAAVLTVSDSCASGTAEDTAGPATAALLQEHLQARVAWTGIEPDDRDCLVNRLEDLSGRGLDLVLTVGGTGCGPRDVTPEATRAVLDKEVPGLAEAMRAASVQLTPHAMLQRGVAGIRRSSLILNLPGSRKGATENLEAVLPALAHAVELVRGGRTHLNDERSSKVGDLPVIPGSPGDGRR
jgi:molybdopterin adenylyltransferase